MAVTTLTIDGIDIAVEAGSTILEAAEEAGVHIPTLCHLEGVSNVGACRLCLVEVEGVNKLLPACVTEVSEQMQVYVNTPRLQEYRKLVVEMLFAEGNHICAICVANNNCELQDLAIELGMDHSRLAYRFPADRDVDISHERFGIDRNRCVLCTRCVRVCDEIEGAHVWDVAYRGFECKVVTGLNQPWGEVSACTACGKCVDACPTGAIFRKGVTVAEMERDRAKLEFLVTAREKKRMDKIKFATIWLAGCSGCHMSFLDLDEWLIELAQQVDVVYSPVGSDYKDYPDGVDVCLVEGAVANADNLELIREVREKTKLLVSFGDCAVTANVPAMRNLQGGADGTLQRCYLELGDDSRQLPHAPGIVPELLDRVCPVHEVVTVDLFLPGCPPSAERIQNAIAPLLEAKKPEIAGRDMIKFG